MKFIYVMDSESKERLMGMGFTLLKEDDRTGVCMFLNACGKYADADIDVPHVLSNIMTF